MSLFSWFTRKSKAQAPQSRPPYTAAHSRMPGMGGTQAPVPPATELRKTERMERREQLYQAVRDTMVRAGILSAGYKFKVLSLDQRGAQFLVMIDVTHEYGRDVVRLTEIEALIVQTAKSRFDILVTAVYWRVNAVDQFLGAAQPPKVTAPVPAPAPTTAAATSAPAAPATATARPESTRLPPLVPPPVPSTATATPAIAPAVPRPGQRYEPIDADEVAAFKQALARASTKRPPTPLGDSVRTGPILRPSSTDFEDTVMPEQDGRSSDLSGTQYGDLR